jgi:hypothetical protein
MNRTNATPVILLCCLTAVAFSQTPVTSKVPPVCATPDPACARSLITQRARRFSANTAGAIPAAKPLDMPPSAQYNFVTLVIPAAVIGAQANAINNDGLVAGYYLDANYTAHGFTWQQGQVQTVDYPGAVATFLNGINNRGLIIGYYYDVNYNSHAVIYSVPSGTWSTLPDIEGYSANTAFGIDDDGVASGSAYGYLGSLSWTCPLATLRYAFFTEPGAAQASTYATAINSKLNVVGWFYDVPANGEHGFLKQGGEYTSFTIPDAFVTLPTGINRAGTIVGLTFFYGFVRTRNGVISSVNVPASFETDIYGINDQGVICGDFFDSNFNEYAIIASPVGSSAIPSPPA